MSYFESRVGGNSIQMFYQDQGKGRPVLLIHGWPLSHEMWEYQVSFLIEQGCRVITYDRRGFGKSDSTVDSYDYDSLSDDLSALIEHLNLQDITLVGFSMGGGEVIRYMSRHAGAKVKSIVLVSTVVPLLLKTQDHPDGVPAEMFDGFEAALRTDRAGFLEQFAKAFYGIGLLSHPVSTAHLNWDLQMAMQASPIATIGCMYAFSRTDFRAELDSIKVPCLIIHGDADKTVPIQATSRHTAEMISHARYLVYEGAPHGLFFTEKDKLNADLLEFLRA